MTTSRTPAFRWVSGSPWPRRCVGCGHPLRLTLTGGTAAYICDRNPLHPDEERAA